jgi:hypothetical protein
MSHVKVIRKEIEDGNFTPTSVSVGVREFKQEGTPHPEIHQELGRVAVTVPDGATLPLLDGGHRFQALELLYQQEAYRENIGKSDIVAILLLDGNTKKDFLNLQKGRPVDKSHIHSLSVKAKLLAAKDANVLTFAYDTAILLNTDERSPFKNQIRFDSHGVSGIPISSLSGKGASDIATSLVGGAKIALGCGKDPAWLAENIIIAFTYLKANASELFEQGMKLTPPPNGTKGSATMIIGVGNMLAARVGLQGELKANNKDIEKLVEAAKQTLSEPVKGNFSGALKRDLMGAFAEKFFADVEHLDFHFGVPKKLVEVLSTSTFSTPKLEKVKVEKPKKEKKAPEPEVPPEELFDAAAPKAEKEPSNQEPVEVTEKAPWEEFEG